MIKSSISSITVSILWAAMWPNTEIFNKAGLQALFNGCVGKV
jgi:hypothetical protein